MGGPEGWASGREGRLIPYIDTRQTPNLCEREKIMTRSTKPVPEREASAVLLLWAAPLAASTLREACGWKMRPKEAGDGWGRRALPWPRLWPCVSIFAHRHGHAPRKQLSRPRHTRPLGSRRVGVQVRESPGEGDPGVAVRQPRAAQRGRPCEADGRRYGFDVF
ncbi:hypothetical protein E2C01_044984 [Portunus trituberculatus]|uniref:Uncharacterized protein n=1 Tax=Portunus trituberculatus TaxID=210409 RepID=A0A5B7FX15_PORTR|nr:hypothetical protein [Portunus trituberculatus]